MPKYKDTPDPDPSGDLHDRKATLSDAEHAKLHDQLLSQLEALVANNAPDCPVCSGGEVYPCPKCNPEENKAHHERTEQMRKAHQEREEKLRNKK